MKFSRRRADTSEVTRRRRFFRRRNDRGATLAEYALIVSALALVSLGALGSLNTSAASYFGRSASTIGKPSNKLNYLSDGSRPLSGPASTTTSIAP